MLAGKPHRFITGWEEASGNIDAEGSKLYVEQLLQKDPKEFQKCILVADGDSYQRRWQKVPGAEGWICAKCVSPLTSGSYMSGGSAAAVKALATAAEMFDLTGGNSEEGEAALDEEGNEAGLEIEEGPV